MEDKMTGVEESMVEFLMTNECRRVVLDRIMERKFNMEGCLDRGAVHELLWRVGGRG
jgi:hypothetical protein